MVSGAAAAAAACVAAGGGFRGFSLSRVALDRRATIHHDTRLTLYHAAMCAGEYLVSVVTDGEMPADV